MKFATPAVVAVGIVGVGLAGTPRLLSNFEFFEIRQVEVVGLRYLTPDRILDAARVDEAGNLLRGLGEVEDRIRSVPGVANVRLDRKLPGTLRIAIVELVPVAFVIGQEVLIPVDEHAQPLPYDPTASPMDLPILPQGDSALTMVLAEVRRAAPALFDMVDDASRGVTGGVVLTIGDRRLILPEAATAAIVQSVVAVQRRILESEGDFEELDARYDGLIISRGDRS